MKVATCAADVGLTCNILYKCLYVLIPIDEVEYVKKTKYVKRSIAPFGYIVYAGWDKYKKGIPHRLTTKKNFDNSMMLSMSMGDGRYCSISIYKKKLHICGCKSESELMNATKELVKKLVWLNGIIEQIKNSYMNIRTYLTKTHIYMHNKERLYSTFGDMGIVMESYLSTVLFSKDAITFLDWICSIDTIIENGRGLSTLNVIEYLDIHNISADTNIGNVLVLVDIANILNSHGYDVTYSNIHDTYVHVVIPYDEIDPDTTRRRKSRFVFNFYKTGSIKIYGPSEYGMSKHLEDLLNIIKSNNCALNVDTYT